MARTLKNIVGFVLSNALSLNAVKLISIYVGGLLINNKKNGKHIFNSSKSFQITKYC